MRILNIFLAILLISLLILAMLIFLNPFTWGMRAKEVYRFSDKFNQIINEIQKESIFNNINYDAPSQWYVKDCNRGYINKKENLYIWLGKANNKGQKTDTFFLNRKINFYAEKIIRNTPEKIYYDSLVLVYEYKVNRLSWTSADHFKSVRQAYKIK